MIAERNRGRGFWRIVYEIGLAMAAFGGLGLGIAELVWPGHVEVLPPTGVGLIRGLAPFPSDHLFIPLVWSNTGRRSRLVRDIRLLFVPLGAEGDDDENGELYFALAGEYEEMSPSLIGGELSAMRSSILLSPLSAEERILVFHVFEWWREGGNTYRFQFAPGQHYRVYLLYKLGAESKQRQKYLFKFPGDWDALEKLLAPGPGGPAAGLNWDYYDLSFGL